MVRLNDGEWLTDHIFDGSERDEILSVLRDARRHEGVQLLIRDFGLRRRDLLERLATTNANDVAKIGATQGGISAYSEILSFFDTTIELIEKTVTEGTDQGDDSADTQ